jgi:hypothetical protein
MAMKRGPFLSAIRAWCRKNARSFEVDTVAGKGSHVKVRVGASATIVKDGELSPIYMEIVLKQLGIPKDAVRGKR